MENVWDNHFKLTDALQKDHIAPSGGKQNFDFRDLRKDINIKSGYCICIDIGILKACIFSRILDLVPSLGTCVDGIFSSRIGDL